jgi:predicted nucleic acid-binding protein
MTFLDTSALVGALLEKHPQHAACLRALQAAANPVSDAHALAEKFATFTGFYMPIRHLSWRWLRLAPQLSPRE